MRNTIASISMKIISVSTGVILSLVSWKDNNGHRNMSPLQNSEQD